jgi:hypothetical protein
VPGPAATLLERPKPLLATAWLDLTVPPGRCTLSNVSGFSSEAALIDEVRQRLVRKFADLPEDHVSTAVTEAQARFAGSKVRGFVPLLVERRVSGELSRPGAALGY